MINNDEGDDDNDLRKGKRTIFEARNSIPLATWYAKDTRSPKVKMDCQLKVKFWVRSLVRSDLTSSMKPGGLLSLK